MAEDIYDQMEETPEPSHPIDLRNLLDSILDRFWIIAICTALAGIAGVIYALRSPIIYASTAVLKIETEQPKIINIEGVLEDDVRGEGMLREKFKEVEQTMRGRDILSRVIITNNLATDARFYSRQGQETVTPAKLVPNLARLITIQPRPGTRLVNVTVEHGDPQLATLLANSLVSELIRHQTESYKEATKQATSFLAEEAQRIQQNLRQAEAMLHSYKDESLSLEQRQAIVSENLKDLNAMVNAAKSARIRVEMEYAPVKEMGRDVQALLTIPTIATDPAVAATRASIVSHEVEFEKIKQVYKQKHPTYIEHENRLAKLREVLAQTVLKVAERMGSSLETAFASERALEEELKRQEAVALSLNKEFVPYNVLLRDIEQYRALYDSVVKRMGETTIAGNLEHRRVQIFQSAEVPSRPVKPEKRRIVLGSTLAGFALGLLVALGLTLMDSTLKTVDETELLLRVPVLSTIPRVRLDDRNGGQIVMTSERRLSGAESFRSMRATLSLDTGNGAPRSFLFTSALPEEGKTFCAANFAASLAQQGHRTLLIDCDLRRPMVAQVFKNEARKELGVTDYLLCSKPLDQLVQPTSFENLFFVTGGTSSTKPSELLGTERLADLLRESLEQFDRVIVDSAPIFGVSDTMLLINRVHRVCMVVRARQTPRKIVIRALHMLMKGHAPLSGVVLNAMPRSRRAGYGDPYYDYGYYSKKEKAMQTA